MGFIDRARHGSYVLNYGKAAIALGLNSELLMLMNYILYAMILGGLGITCAYLVWGVIENRRLPKTRADISARYGSESKKQAG